MSTNLALTLSYDGTPFFGWQKTQSGPSVEGHLEQAIEKILQHPITLQAASRTDRGVHAEEQIVNLFTQKNLDINMFKFSLNALLPKAIRILSIQVKPSYFHPTLDAIGKEYHYRICLGPVQLPHNRFFSWHVPQKLDIQKMRAAAKQLEGTFDFSSFCTKVNYKDAIRTLYKVRILEEEGQLVVVMQGDNFLYKMARTLVGTLVYIGRGKLVDIPEILASRERVEAGITAPAHGLVLKRVFY